MIKLITHEIAIEEVDVGGSIQCGLRQEWVTGTADGVLVELSSGAGLGNRWMQISIATDEGRRYFRADMRQFLQSFVDAVRAENSAAGA